MGIDRQGPTPQFLDYIAKRYLIHGHSPEAERAKQSIKKINPSIRDIEIPNFQRKLVWKKENVRELVYSESPLYGNVILAKQDEKKPYKLLDGLQRLATGTLILLKLHKLVLTDSPINVQAAKNFVALKRFHTLHDIVEENHYLLSNHRRKIIAESYLDLEIEVDKLINQEIDEPEFPAAITKMFLENCIALDEYSGFESGHQMIRTFVNLNNTGLDLKDADLLRDALLENAENLGWDIEEQNQLEDDFSGVFFSGNDQPKLQMLASYLNFALDKHQQKKVFPNWDKFTKKDYDVFYNYLMDFKKAKDDPEKFPYLSEIFAVGGLPFTFAFLYFWFEYVLKNKKPDFCGGDIDTTSECYQLLRACYRRLLWGKIGRMGSMVESYILGSKNFEDVVKEINPSDVFGDLDQDLKEETLHVYLFQITVKEQFCRIFNACMLPERNGTIADFKPLIFGRSADEWAIDHLKPKATLLEKQPGFPAGNRLTNLAPLTNDLNQRVKALQCKIKLGENEAYRQVKDEHPYLKWLVETHYQAPKGIDQNVWLENLDTQECLDIGSSEMPVGKNRIQELARLLAVRI